MICRSLTVNGHRNMTKGLRRKILRKTEVGVVSIADAAIRWPWASDSVRCPGVGGYPREEPTARLRKLALSHVSRFQDLNEARPSH